MKGTNERVKATPIKIVSSRLLLFRAFLIILRLFRSTHYLSYNAFSLPSIYHIHQFFIPAQYLLALNLQCHKDCYQWNASQQKQHRYKYKHVLRWLVYNDMPNNPCGIYQKEYHPHVKIDTYTETNYKKYSPVGYQGCNNRKSDGFV